MDLKIIDLADNHAKFVISGIRPDMANALRRTLMTEVPKMAIETVEFHLGPIRDEDGKECESVSPLFDEIISHRLGLIPIPTDPDLYVFKDKCTCEGEGCPNCTIMYSLNKKGPCDVYSGDLEPLGGQELRVKDELIPIVKLGPKQALLIYASAELGTAKRHAKWQVTSGCGYRYYPTVTIDPGKCDASADCVKVCPRGVLEKKDGKVVVANLEACILCGACVDACIKNAISIHGDDRKFIFEFETDGSMSSRDTLRKAFEVLEKKFDDFREDVSTLIEG
ncbi:MAG: DNA-directed RNA polymerase subunit D [Methanomassiliicoccales archaeon PtaU1.Bin030]|jgi:DNA-directed RNA polymerase subunit D|nr:MAG: DNA-directed RNA polymerase subunit D [Methanomassiliicoccales archaeon PtaU1.Bin030]